MIRSLSQLSPESFIGSVLRMPLRLIPKSSVVRVRSGLNKGARWIVGSSIHKCWLGTYELEKQDLISKLIRPGSIVWDVGANAGFYTIAFSRLAGDGGRVYAFEPLAENVNNVLNHVRLNDLQNVVVVQVALGEREELIGFLTADLNAMGFLSSQATAYLVPTFTVDSFVANHPEARPDLLKVDVEGAESALLRGASRCLREVGPDVVLALHGEDQSRQCTEQLKALGYSLYDLDGSPMASIPGYRGEIFARKAGMAAGNPGNEGDSSE